MLAKKGAKMLLILNFTVSWINRILTKPGILYYLIKKKKTFLFANWQY